MKRPVIVAISGLDGAGKTTLRQQMMRRLSGQDFELFYDRLEVNDAWELYQSQANSGGKLFFEDHIGVLLNYERYKFLRHSYAQASSNSADFYFTERFEQDWIAIGWAFDRDSKEERYLKDLYAPYRESCFSIFIDTPPQVCAARVSKRGGQSCPRESFEYLQMSYSKLKEMESEFSLVLDGAGTIEENTKNAIISLLSWYQAYES